MIDFGEIDLDSVPIKKTSNFDITKFTVNTLVGCKEMIIIKQLTCFR